MGERGVVELYKVGHGRDFTHSMYSVAKSFVVTLQAFSFARRNCH
jgi:hypothetical protein